MKPEVVCDEEINEIFSDDFSWSLRAAFTHVALRIEKIAFWALVIVIQQGCTDAIFIYNIRPPPFILCAEAVVADGY
jgi:hypothetical protein